MTNYLSFHNKSLVADLHCDTVLWIRSSNRDISRLNTEGHIDLPRLKTGGVNLQLFACFISSETKAEQAKSIADNLLTLLTEACEKNSDQIALAKNATEANSIIKSGRIAAIAAIENGLAIANSLENLSKFYDRGVRYMTLTHSLSHDWCASSTDPHNSHEGLTSFGREVITRMNDLGMMVDISHISNQAVTDILAGSNFPVIASHSCAHAICGHARNLTDDQIRQIADKGGMVGINFCRDFLSKSAWQASTSFLQKYPGVSDQLNKLVDGSLDPDQTAQETVRLKPLIDEWDQALADASVSVSDVVDHIDHIVKLVGADFVGLGSDFDGITCPPDSLEDISRMPAITKELFKRNYPESDITKILGGNFMRVFEEVCGK